MVLSTLADRGPGMTGGSNGRRKPPPKVGPASTWFHDCIFNFAPSGNPREARVYNDLVKEVTLVRDSSFPALSHHALIIETLRDHATPA